MLAVGATGEDVNGFESGSVYIYELENGKWILQQKLLGSDTKAYDRFGYSIDLDGHTLVVGTESVSGNGEKGEIYVFEYKNGRWIETAILEPRDNQTRGRFGHAVIVDNDKIIASAPWSKDGGTVYVFQKNGNSWIEVSQLHLNAGITNPLFGWDLALHNNSLIIGAPLENDRHGAAYIYRKKGIDTWEQVVRLFDPDLNTRFKIGGRLGLTENIAIVGGYGLSNKGAALIFEHSNDKWSFRNKITNPIDPNMEDRFACAVSINSNQLLIGAESDKEGSMAGAAYVWGLSTITDISNTESRKTQVIPNPVDDIAWIVSQEQYLEIEIYNSNGTMVLKKSLSSFRTDIDLSDFLPGLYIIRATEKSNGIFPSQFIKLLVK